MPTFEPVDFDPFVQKKQPTLEPVDFDPFAAPARGPETPAPAASARTLAPNDGVNPGTPAAPPQNSPAPAINEPASFSGAYWETFSKENPELMAEALEGFSHSAGETAGPYLKSASDFIRSNIQADSTYRRRVPSVFDIDSLQKAGDWAKEAIGSGLASSTPSIVTGAAGAAGGAAVGGPVGGVVGGAVGAGSSAFMMNYGDVYKSLKEEKVDPKRAASISWYAAVPMAALDAAVPASVIAKFGGMKEVKREVARGIARRILANGLEEGSKESITEAAQQAIQEFTIAAETGKDFLTQETGKKVIDAAAGGFLPGGVMGAPAGIRRDRTANPATAQDAAQAAEAVAGVATVPTGAPTPAPASLVIDPSQVSGEIASPPAPTFYSPTRKAIEEKGPGAASAEQWLATIRQTPGVKQEELSDTGLERFLEERKGQRISKDEMLDYLEDHAIVVTETQRTGRPPAGWQGVVGTDPNQVRYEEYTLPGARQGYTELLLQIPERDVVTTREVQSPQGWGDTDGGNIGIETVGDNGNDYRTGHWPGNPNVVAHVRLTERTDTSGAPIAFVEEIQSDWIQTGQRQGFRGFENITQLRQEYEAAVRQRDIVNAQTATIPVSEERQAAHIRVAETAARLTRAEGGGVPNAPFKQSWDELAIKRVIRWAADKGYTRIGFPTGAQVDLIQKNENAGRRAFYDKKIPALVKKWAKRLGGTIEYVPISSAPMQIYELDYLARDQEVGAYNTRTGEFIRFDRLSEALYRADMQTNQNLIDRVLDEAQAEVDAMNREASPTEPHVVPTLRLSPEGVRLAQKGLPLYSQLANEGDPEGVEVRAPIENVDKKAQENIRKALMELVRQFKVPYPVRLQFHKTKNILLNDGTRHQALGIAEMNAAGGPIIHISMPNHKGFMDMWATISHEFGHIVYRTMWHKVDPATKQAVRAAFEKWLQGINVEDAFTRVLATRDNAPLVLAGTRGFPDRYTFAQVANIYRQKGRSEEFQYWLQYEEWFVEQVARWATTSAKPVTLVEKFFKGFANKLIAVLKAAYEKFNLDFQPIPVMKAWLDSHINEGTWMEVDADRTDAETREDNQEALDPKRDERAEPQQPETTLPRVAMKELFGGEPPKDVKQTLAQADKFNFIYKWGLALQQLAERNKHIRPLQLYTEIINVAQMVKQAIMGDAHETLKMWQALGTKQADSVARLLEDVTNMVYRTDDEVKKGVSRFPTQQEMQVLIEKNGVTSEGVQVFKAIAKQFSTHLDRLQTLLTHEAGKIADPVEQARAIYNIEQRMKAMRSVPYFPFMRFGNYTITIRDSAGKVIHFETFQKERVRNAALKELKRKLQPGETITPSFLKEQSRPLIGVPTAMLDLMAQRLNLSPDQRQAMEQLRFELAPAQSFRHRFQNKNRTKGYSQDFQRAFANYFFHGANHFTKVRYGSDLRELIAATENEVKVPGIDTTKRQKIVNFMQDHLDNWLDPKSDWAAVRSIAFLWAIAWSPASAALNLTQTLTTTFPFLAAKYGDHKAVAAMLRAGTQVNSFYKKGAYEGATEFELKAIGEAVRDGTITEAMATELAAIGEGRNLTQGFGGNVTQKAIQKFNEYGALLFELAEQTNRRVTFRAALKLAQADPMNKHNAAMRQKHALAFQTLRDQGWTEAEAEAYVVAKDAVDTTQFKYGRDFNPRFMRGKARSIFVFKTFVQNMLFFLYNQPSAAVRSVLIMGFLGGLMGLPGAEDLNALLKVVAWRFFGKDFDLEKETRKFVVDFLGNDEDARQRADTVLHGAARKGFGIPQMLDMLGGTVGVDVPMPTFDRSRAVGMGLLLPVDLGKLFGPPTNSNAADSAIASEAQRASGAVFGTGFNIYKALTDMQLDWSDPKRWEKAVPRSVANVSKAYRAFTEGRERNRKDGTVINYDVNDTEQLMEIVGLAAGYTPYRQALEWDRVIAGQEAIKYWDIRRSGILTQYSRAMNTKDPEQLNSMREAVRKFNADLPQYAKSKTITADSLRRSMEARQRARSAQEAGSSVRKTDIPILREIQRMYPESQATVRRVGSAGPAGQ